MKLNCYNKYPNCLSLELTNKCRENSQGIKELDLYLNLDFNEQIENIGLGKVKFALKGGQLKLSIGNGEITWFNDDLPKLVLVEKKWVENETVWYFSGEEDNLFLTTSLKDVKIATVKIKGNPYTITSKFCLEKSDIHLGEIEGLWNHDITPNKHGILTARIVLHLLNHKIQSCLSCCNFNEEVVDTFAVEEDENSINISSVIKEIYGAKTDNFLELAQMASLNPKTDLEGANLMACEVKGADLTGANLDRVNLRGADLTDADLSEAKLNYARLSGADLSGAYLSNANLKGANLHRASLALANLSGADLSDANLTEANLSNTNLSGATLRGVRFGNNPGISEETKNTLSKRGAIFEN